MAQTVRDIIRNGLRDLEPIGSFVTKRGDIKVVWPVMGGAEDGDGAADGGGDGSGDGTGSEDQGDQGKDGEEKPDDASSKGTPTREEYEALERRMKAADKRATDAETKVKEYEDKDKDELTKATDKVTELENDVKGLSEAVTTLRIENEFLASNKYTWHNPKRALSLVDLSEVTIDDDGKVVGLDKALDALAKSDAYLLKTGKDGEEEEIEGGKPNGSSGSPVGSGSSKDKKAADAAALRSRFPALNR